MAIAFIYEKKYGSQALQPKEDENIKKAERRWRRVYSENDCKSSRDPQNAAESTDDCYKIHSMLVIATWSEAYTWWKLRTATFWINSVNKKRKPIATIRLNKIERGFIDNQLMTRKASKQKPNDPISTFVIIRSIANRACSREASRGRNIFIVQSESVIK